MADASPREHLDALVGEYHEDPYLSDEDAATLVEADIDEKWEPGDQESLASWSRRNAIKWRLRKMRGGERRTEPTPAPEMVAMAPQAPPKAAEPLPEVSERRVAPAEPPKAAEDLLMRTPRQQKPKKRTSMDRPRQRRQR